MIPPLLSLDPRRGLINPLLPAQVPVVPPTMLASAAPMLPPGAAVPSNENGYTYGQFPDVPQEVPPPMGMPELPAQQAAMNMGDLPEEPQSGYRDFGDVGGAMPSASPAMPSEGGGMPSPPGGWGNALRAVGLGLYGLGNPRTQSPLLAQLAARQMYDDQQGQGMREAISALTAAQQGGGGRGAYVDNLRGALQRLGNNPQAFRLLYPAFTRAQEDAIKSGELTAANIAQSQVLGMMKEGKDLNDIVAEYPDLIAKMGGRDALKAISELTAPTDFEHGGERYRSYKYGPKSKLPPERILGEGPKAEPIDQLTSDEIGGLGYTNAEIQKALRDPNLRDAALAVVTEARQRAKVGARTRGVPLPQLADWLRANPNTPLPNFFRMQEERLPGGVEAVPGAGAAEAAKYGQQEQADKLDVSKKQGEAAAQIREDAARRAPAIQVEGLKSPETEIYDMTTGKKVNKLLPGILGEAEKNPGRYRIVQGDDTKALRAVAGIEKFVPMFEEVSKRLTDQPGANVVQQIEFALKDRFGVAGMNTVINTMQGSQLVLAKAFQGTGSQLSDADRKTVEGLVPKSGDTGQQVMQKVNFLKTYTRLIRAAVLDDDAAADNALVDFVKNLPRTGGGKGGQIVPGQGIQVVP